MVEKHPRGLDPHITRILAPLSGLSGVDRDKLHPRWVPPAGEAIVARLAVLELRAGGSRNRAMSIRISSNICRDTATSASWDVTLPRGILGGRPDRSRGLAARGLGRCYSLITIQKGGWFTPPAPVPASTIRSSSSCGGDSSRWPRQRCRHLVPAALGCRSVSARSLGTT